MRLQPTPFFILCLLFWLTDCRLPDHFIENNNPDAAFNYAANKLKRKKIKTKHLKALEFGFNAANERDINYVQNLKNKNDLNSWKKIHNINQALLLRQEKIEPYLPMVSEEGYRPFLKLNPVKEWEEDSFWKVTELYLKEIRKNLEMAAIGEKLKARQANYLIQQLVNEHGYNNQEIHPLEDSTFMLGKSYFLLNFYTSPHLWHGREITDWLYGYDYFFRKNFWKDIYLLPQPSVKYDFMVDVNLDREYVSGDNINSSCEYFEKEIEVGKKEVKDTSGKVTYEPIFEKISATVTSYTITKEASINAEIIVFEQKSGSVILRKNICGTDSFCGTYCTISGDSRATSKSCGISFISSPSDWSMLGNCANGLQGQIMWHLKNVDISE